MGHIGDQVVAVLVAIVGVAIIAVIVSKKSDTANVIQAAAGGFAQALGTAVSPITGSVGAGGGFTNFGGGIPQLRLGG